MRTYHLLHESSEDTLDIYYVFSDDEKIAKWAKEDVYEAQKFGLIKGKNENMFDPNNNATRAESATVFYRLLLKFKQ